MGIGWRLGYCYLPVGQKSDVLHIVRANRLISIDCLTRYMGERERNERGQYVETVTRERVLDSLREGGHVMTAVEVGDALGCTPETATRKLSELFDEGEVNRKEVGAHAVVWWLPDDNDVEPSETSVRYLSEGQDSDRENEHETTTDEPDNRTHERAAEAFAQRARDALGDSIHELILFGSTVRGETRGRDSDVDMFVVLDSTEHEDELNKIAFDVTLEYGVAVSVHTQPKERFEHRKDHPFVNQVLTEGRSYA